MKDRRYLRYKVVADVGLEATLVAGHTCRRPHAVQLLFSSVIGQMSKCNILAFWYAYFAKFEFPTLLSGSF